MSWALLGILIVVLATAFSVLRHRRAELARTARGLAERARARQEGSDRARLQYPHVDLSRCMGCGSCVRACPEEGVLELIHGQAMVVHGARCVGHGLCAEECPVGAIALTLGDIEDRRDIPALTEDFESTRTPGLFLAGEVTGYSLIRTAIGQGTAVAGQVSRRIEARRGSSPAERGLLDLAIVGAGPAGLACSLEAKSRNLRFVTLEQAELGGAVSKYPRRKLVMTQPVELPLVGTLRRASWEKEDLVRLWRDVASRHALPIRTGVEFLGLERANDGIFVIETSAGRLAARHVCLALGRRGSPQKLGVPGEDLPKVAYGLIDAQSYTGRRILVVGGGDSAAEAALALSEQTGNQVYLSYRRRTFFRLRSRNMARLREAVAAGRVRLLLETEVTRIEEGVVHLTARDGKRYLLENDDVFVMAGATTPFPLLEKAGVSFDPADRPAAAPLVEQGTGLARGLGVALALSVAILVWTAVFAQYYALRPAARPSSPLHPMLRPSGPVGLACGVGSVLLILGNLAYLARRSGRFPWIPGSLRAWMSAHVATGISALLLALVHGAMAPRNTVGGHALVALVVLVLTGAIGRYFYSFVPRAANGRELLLEEVRARLSSLLGEGDRQNPEFAERVRAEVRRLTAEGRWRGSFLTRLAALLRSDRRLRESVGRLRAEAARARVSREQLADIVSLARRAQRAALMAAHYEDLRTLLASWRFLHRWAALAMVLLVGRHVWAALRFARLGGLEP